MTDITINGNSDTIHISRKGEKTIEMPCPHPRKVAQILNELINIIVGDNDLLPANISLNYIDEDNRTNIGEW